MYISFYCFEEKPNLFLKAGAGVPEGDQIFISFRIGLDPNIEIELTTEENFRRLIGHMSIHAETEISKGKSDDIGEMIYFSSMEDIDARYFVDVHVPKPLFDEILSTARTGHAPSEIAIYVSGMDFGHAPDGSEIKWDNMTLPKLKIASISFTIPLLSSTLKL